MTNPKNHCSIWLVLCLSAYGCSSDASNDSAVRAGYGQKAQALTPAETLEACNQGTLGALVGEEGLAGNNGPQGDTGIKGDDGPQGEAGTQGNNGLPGNDGPEGETGPQGPRAAPHLAAAGGLTGGAPIADQAGILTDTPITLDVAQAQALLLAGKHCPQGSELVGFDGQGNVRCSNANSPLSARMTHVAPQATNHDRTSKTIVTTASEFINDASLNISTQMPPVPSLKVRFQSTGGPVLLQSQLSIRGTGGHATCPLFIDGQPAAQRNNAGDIRQTWWDGLTDRRYHWNRWTSARLYHGLTPGWHEAHVACIHSGGPLGYSALGYSDGTPNNQLDQTVYLSALPLSHASTTDGIRAYSANYSPDPTDPNHPEITVADTYVQIPNLSIAFESRGGPLRVAINLPLMDGSHGSCQPRFKQETSQANAEPLDRIHTNNTFLEGRLYSGADTNHVQWARTRIYPGLPSGERYEISVWCATDTATMRAVVSSGNKSHAHLAVLEYPSEAQPDGEDGNLNVHFADHVDANATQDIAGDNTPVVLTSPRITFDNPSSSGIAEIGFSLPYTANGSIGATCRPVIDTGSGFELIPSHSSVPNDYLWHDGAITTGGNNTVMMNQARFYENLPTGQGITLGIRCSGDTGSSHTFHHNNSASSLFVVLMKP